MAYALKTFLDFLSWNCLKSLCYFILLSNLEFWEKYKLIFFNMLRKHKEVTSENEVTEETSFFGFDIQSLNLILSDELCSKDNSKRNIQK